MPRISYSGEVKAALQAEEIKKKCCRHTYDDMMAIDLTDIGKCAETMSLIYSRCRCDGCRAVFIRALFIMFGSLTNPSRGYHLDFLLRTESEREVVRSALSECGFTFHIGMRLEKYLLYVKSSSEIEDFLMFIGARNAAFDIMNLKIEREFRNSVNRQVNCDTANIEKQLESVKKYTDAIEYLIESGGIDRLPEELRKTAILRYENGQLSLAELGRLAEPAVSKSGMKHRLERILSFANDMKSEERPE